MQRLIPWTMLVVALGCLGPLRAQEGPPPVTWLLPTPSVPQLETLRPLDEINTPALPDEPGQAPLQSLSSKTDGPLGSLTSNVILRDPRALREEPIPASEWRADNAWKLDVTGPVFLFGQLGADPGTADELKVNGKTGLGCKLPALPGLDVLVRGGQAVSCTDPLRPERGREHAELFVEVQARCPLPGKVGLEYQGAAIPALSPLERDRISQDLRVALPLGDAGQLRVGAKHQWENAATPRDWREGMQLYLGVELKSGRVGR